MDQIITLSSVGKIGWGIGGSEVINSMGVARLWTSFCTNTPCQGAIAKLYRGLISLMKGVKIISS